MARRVGTSGRSSFPRRSATESGGHKCHRVTLLMTWSSSPQPSIAKQSQREHGGCQEEAELYELVNPTTSKLNVSGNPGANSLNLSQVELEGIEDPALTHVFS